MKKILVLLGIMTALAVLAILAILLFLDINAHKPKIETAATQALGMEVKIQGKASLRLFPSVGISLPTCACATGAQTLPSWGSCRWV